MIKRDPREYSSKQRPGTPDEMIKERISAD
jgi:hypothetical protein